MRILILNQAFYPDVVASAQQETDLALGLVEAGHDVTVLSSTRGYDDPSLRFPRREVWNSIRIYRVPTFSPGKSSPWLRALNFAGFLTSCGIRALCLPSFDVVIALTSPPLISVLAALLAPWKRARLLYWTLDLNPDAAIAAGWLQADSCSAKVLSRLQQFSLRRARKVVVLDTFMKQRVMAAGIPGENIAVIPPWSHELKYDLDGRNTFRAQHGLAGKFVVMYSGNHSPCHPLDTLLQAAQRLADHPEIAFCLVGGGSEFAKVKGFAVAHKLTNVVCIPYQPRESLAASLSAADLHVVVMGNPFVGIVHPCKIYNLLAIGAPLLYIGPEPSHVTELLPQISRNGALAYSVRHGDSDAVMAAILQQFKSGSRCEYDDARFSRQRLVSEMITVVESVGRR